MNSVHFSSLLKHVFSKFHLRSWNTEKIGSKGDVLKSGTVYKTGGAKNNDKFNLLLGRDR